MNDSPMHGNRCHSGWLPVLVVKFLDTCLTIGGLHGMDVLSIYLMIAHSFWNRNPRWTSVRYLNGNTLTLTASLSMHGKRTQHSPQRSDLAFATRWRSG